MSHVYKKRSAYQFKKIIRYTGLASSIIGILSLIYISIPLISWKIYFEPVFASNSIQAPIPKTAVLSAVNIQTLLSQAVNSINTDYSDARNWFPQFQSLQKQAIRPAITTYNISIPKLNIKYANVTTTDTDLSSHLVHYPGTPLPPQQGNGVIFGHSTIPSWFNPTDYKTIFATVHTLIIGDKIIATVDTKEYIYSIMSIIITNPDDSSVFAQDTDGSYLTLITCTPPGTTWKRLIIKAKLEN
jgi:sortase A